MYKVDGTYIVPRNKIKGYYSIFQGLLLQYISLVIALLGIPREMALEIST